MAMQEQEQTEKKENIETVQQKTEIVPEKETQMTQQRQEKEQEKEEEKTEAAEEPAAEEVAEAPAAEAETPTEPEQEA